MNIFIGHIKDKTTMSAKACKKSSIFEFIRATSILLGLLVAIGSNDAAAKLPFNSFNGVTNCFKKGYEHFSPTLGMAALDSNLIYNLRFYGNYKKAKDKQGNLLPIGDDPHGDPILILVKELFPSNAGELSTEVTAPQYFSNNIKSPAIIALLLNFVDDIRRNKGIPDEGQVTALKQKIKNTWEQEFPEISVNQELLDAVKLKEAEKMATLAEKLGELKGTNIKDTNIIKIVNNLYGKNFLNLNISAAGAKPVTVNNKIIQISKMQNLDNIKTIIDIVRHATGSDEYIGGRAQEFQKERERSRKDQFNKFFEKQPEVRKGDVIKVPARNSTINKIIDSIIDGIISEFKQDSIYPKHTIEQIIMAFFVAKFNTQDDIKLLHNALARLNPKIVDAAKINEIKLMKFDYLDEMAQNGPYNFDTAYYIQQANTWSAPVPTYSNPKSLLSNGPTFPFDRTNKKIIQDSGTFHDCVEIAMRHFMNLALYNHETKEFDLSSVENFMKRGGQNSYFDYLRMFYQDNTNPLTGVLDNRYKRQTPERAENDTKETRSAWNRVIGDLNAKIPKANNTPRIRYANNKVAYEFEVYPGFINFIHIFEKLLGMKLDMEPAPNSTEEVKRSWLEQSFSKLFEALTYSPNGMPNKKTFEADFSQLKFDGEDFFGALNIEVMQQEKMLFSFTLNEQKLPSYHSWVSNLYYPTTGEKIALSKDISYGVEPDTADEVLWLLKDDKSRINNIFYKMFNEGLQGYDAKFNLLKRINEVYDSADFSSLIFTDTFMGMLRNVLMDLDLSDNHTLDLCAPVLLALGKREKFRELMNEVMATIKIGGIEGSEQSIENISKASIDVIAWALDVNNVTLTTLNLSSFKKNYPEGMNKILDALKINKMLKTLHMCSDYRDIDKLKDILVVNKTLATLDLSSSHLYVEGAIKIATALETNQTLTALNLRRCSLDRRQGDGTQSDEGIENIAIALQVNKTLKSLNLEHNEFSKNGIQTIAEVLRTNTTTITTLSLSESNGYEWNSFKARYSILRGVFLAEKIAEALKENVTLTTLNLISNETHDEGAEKIAGALKFNKTLTTLDLHDNKIGAKGAEKIAEALKDNTTLTTLNLYGNKIGANGVEKIAEALKDNTALTTLNLSKVQINRKGVEELAKALDTNKTLRTLYLSTFYKKGVEKAKFLEQYGDRIKLYRIED